MVAIDVDEVLPQREEASPEQELERKEMCQALEELVKRLPDDLYQVISSRYAVCGAKKETLVVIGLKLGVCKERVRQLEEEGLAWLPVARI